MPELPEVETVKRSLEPNLIGKKIIDIEVRVPKLIKIPEGNVRAFKEKLLNSSFIKVGRRGKYLLFFLDNDYILVIHLRMTGRLIYSKKDEPLDKHTHLIIELNDNNQLRFHDVRKFGLIYLVNKNNLQAISGLTNLGPEPLSNDFSFDYFQKFIKGKKQKVKSLLLNQSFVAGIGNIYADEILFQAKIYPGEIAGNLSLEKQKALFEAIKDRLREGIKYRGTSIRDYVDGFGEIGSFQYHLRVYGKAGQPCPRCGSLIQRAKIGGRSTAYCPICQRDTSG